MTVAQEPLTVSQAVKRVVDALSLGRVKQIVNRSGSRIYDWTNSNHEAAPSVTQAIKLDAAYRAAGFDGTPIIEAYAFRLGLCVTEGTACREQLCADIGEVARECAEAIASGIVVTQPGAPASSIHHALVQVTEARTALVAMDRSLKGFLPHDAVSRGEASGETATS